MKFYINCEEANNLNQSNCKKCGNELIHINNIDDFNSSTKSKNDFIIIPIILSIISIIYVCYSVYKGLTSGDMFAGMSPLGILLSAIIIRAYLKYYFF